MKRTRGRSSFHLESVMFRVFSACALGKGPDRIELAVWDVTSKVPPRQHCAVARRSRSAGLLAALTWAIGSPKKVVLGTHSIINDEAIRVVIFTDSGSGGVGVEEFSSIVGHGGATLRGVKSAWVRSSRKQPERHTIQ